MPDGKEQAERDRQLRRVTNPKTKTEDGIERGTDNGGEESNPDMWADRSWQAFMYGVDVSCAPHSLFILRSTLFHRIDT